MVSTEDSKSFCLGSNPNRATMTKFKYKNKIIETPNIEKKLKRMKLTIQDVEIIKEDIIISNSLLDNIPEWKEKGLVKYRWRNINKDSKEFGYTIYGVINPNIKPKEINKDWILEYE